MNMNQTDYNSNTQQGYVSNGYQAQQPYNTTPGYTPPASPSPTHTSAPGYTPIPGRAPSPKKTPIEKSMRRMTVFFIITLVVNLLSVGVLLFMEGRTTPKKQLDNQKKLVKYMREIGDECLSVKDLEIIEDDEDSYSSSLYICATLKNTSDEDLLGVELKFELFDGDDESLGFETVYYSELEGDAEEEIKEEFYYDDAETVELVYAEAYYKDSIEP